MRASSWLAVSGNTAVLSAWNRAFTCVFASAARIAASGFAITGCGVPAGA
jgi:hypothetical protein